MPQNNSTTTIKNLYLKILGKKRLPESNFVEIELQKEHSKIYAQDLLEYIKTNNLVVDDLTENEKAEIGKKILTDIKENKIEKIRQNIINANTVETHQLVKLVKYPLLNAFVIANCKNIQHFGEVIIVSKADMDKIIDDINLPKNTTYIDIYYSTDVLYCRLRTTNKEELDKALEQNLITIEKYDALLKMI